MDFGIFNLMGSGSLTAPAKTSFGSRSNRPGLPKSSDSVLHGSPSTISLTTLFVHRRL